MTNPIYENAPFSGDFHYPSSEPTADAAVARLAYQLWSDRGRPEGSPEQDWFRAEDLLRSGDVLTVSST